MTARDEDSFEKVKDLLLVLKITIQTLFEFENRSNNSVLVQEIVYLM